MAEPQENVNQFENHYGDIINKGDVSYESDDLVETYEGGTRFKLAFPSLSEVSGSLRFMGTTPFNSLPIMETSVSYAKESFIPWAMQTSLWVKVPGIIGHCKLATFPNTCGVLTVSAMDFSKPELWEALRIVAKNMGYTEVLLYQVTSSLAFPPGLEPIRNHINRRTGNKVEMFAFDPAIENLFIKETKTKKANQTKAT